MWSSSVVSLTDVAFFHEMARKRGESAVRRAVLPQCAQCVFLPVRLGRCQAALMSMELSMQTFDVAHKVLSGMKAGEAHLDFLRDFVSSCILQCHNTKVTLPILPSHKWRKTGSTAPTQAMVAELQ